jgi:uracil-DNA glycosylase family 4
VTAPTVDAIEAIRNPGCTACPLHQSAETVCLMGNGPVPAKIAFVGQSPGAQEDAEGLPFIGAAGQMLDDMLASAGIDRRDVYVTNMNKCHPPQNRPATPAEVKACKPYLEQELALVDPEIVVLLGNSALQGVLGQSGIMSKRGTAIEKDGRTYYPMLHPAYLLRNPAYEDPFKSDLERLKRIHAGTDEKPETEIHPVNSELEIDTLIRLLADVPPDLPISFDVETATTTGRKKGGLQHWAPDWRLDTMSFTWEVGKSWVVAVEHPEGRINWTHRPWFAKLNEALRGKRIIGHNIKFDLQALRVRGVHAVGFFDTMVAHHLLDENEQHGLKYLAKKYLGADAYEKDINYDGGTPLADLVPYNGRDTDYTLRLYHIFRAQLLEQPKLARIFRFISMPAVNALVDVELRGFPVDVRRLRDRNQKVKQALEYLDQQMAEFVPPHLRKDRNWRPTKFLRHLLFHVLSLPVVSMTGKSNVESLNEDVMVALRNYHPIMPMLLAWRKYDKWSGTYTRKWIDLLKLTGEPRLHPSYNVIGTVTGRLSSNFQQVPRDPFIRGIIGAPPGYKIIEADFSQIELRVAAMLSMDSAMMEVYQQGGDIHMVMAQAITNKVVEDVTKEERSRAKPVNFGFLYGMGWRKFIPYARKEYDIEISETEAQTYRRTFFERFPRLAFWHEKQKRMVEHLGYVESPIGRRRRLPDVRSTDKEVAGEAMRQAINSPVQGFASDLCLMAIGILEDHPSLAEMHVRMLGQLHDSIIFEAPAEAAEDAAGVIKDVMENLPIREVFGYEMPVPVVADVAVVQHWGGK